MDEVEKYYDQAAKEEWDRLKRHKVEFDITKRYMQKYIAPKSKVLDVGGGPGRYAIFLAKKGHDVTLLDLSKENIKLAKKKAEENNLELKKYIHGNALKLEEDVKEKFDTVLCMGPLYHLTDKNERKKVVNQCLKRLKKGGKLFVSFISAYAPTIDFIKKNPEELAKYGSDFLLNYLEDGKNIVSSDNPGFITAHFINPAEIEPFMNNFALKKEVISGIEGLTAQNEEKINKLSDKAYEEWLDLIFETSKNPMTWASCEHLLYIGTKI
ncbi:MAG TPA: methyltransferase domain-containing protein [Halanaerobiales bacterium]|nr:methyltransferase domain-containing protein [Halanaerobiales bacterium]